MGNYLSEKVPVVSPRSRKRIESDALIFLSRHQPKVLEEECPVDIERIFEIDIPNKIPGLETGYIDLEFVGPHVMGYTSAEQQVSYVHKDLYEMAIENPESSTARRFRATVAHEIAHCLYHYSFLRGFRSVSSHGQVSGVMRQARGDIPAYKDPEWQAWEKAGALLMPKPIIESLLRKGKTVQEIADTMNLNPAFVENRIERLNRQKKGKVRQYPPF